MRSTLVDAGPLIALFDAHDSHHAALRRFLEDFRSRLFTTWPVLTKATHMLSFSVLSQMNLLTWIKRNGVQIFPLAITQLRRLITLLQKYSDLPLDLADGSLLIAAEDLGVSDILTIDSDYSVYRMANGRALRNVLRGYEWTAFFGEKSWWRHSRKGAAQSSTARAASKRDENCPAWKLNWRCSRPPMRFERSPEALRNVSVKEDGLSLPPTSLSPRAQ